MIFTNILQGKKYGVVQTVSTISRNFLFLTIKSYDFMWARADYYSYRHQCARGHKTIGSHLNILLSKHK